VSDGRNAPSVLVVEDHAPARYVRKRILERAGFHVVEAATADEALQHTGVALVLLDVSLPDADGFWVCDRLKAASPALPVVMITSVYRSAEARREALSLCADAYLLEPVAPENLVRVITTLLGRGGHAAPPSTEPDDLWIITDAAGYIQEMSPRAPALLNISARGAFGRNLLTYFTEDRSRLVQALQSAVGGTIIQQSTMLRPRDRRPVRVCIDAAALPGAAGERTLLQWVITAESGDAIRETTKEQHERLRHRTDALAEEHANIERKEFNLAEHEQHRKDLQQHKADLADLRLNDEH
jgi:CheY-like chemotaxis protein